MKHIKMPRKIAEQWLKDLRSGEFKQGHGELHDEEKDSYCCLGVLCHQLMAPDQSYSEVSKDGNNCYPSVKFLEAHGVKFIGEEDIRDNPYLTSLRLAASCANDRRLSFNTIADAIEQEVEYTDDE